MADVLELELQSGEEFTDSLDGILIPGPRGPIGETGPRGEKGDAFVYEDFTPEQLEALRGPQGIQGPQGLPGNGDMSSATYDPQGKAQDIFQYVDDAVGNIPTPDVSGQIQTHNTDAAAHSDIRELIENFSAIEATPEAPENGDFWIDTDDDDMSGEVVTSVNGKSGAVVLTSDTMPIADETASTIGLGSGASVDDALDRLGGDMSRVGDVKTSARADYGDGWLLCRGGAVINEEYNELASMLEENLGTSSSIPPRKGAYDFPTMNKHNLAYYNGKWYFVRTYGRMDGANGQNGGTHYPSGVWLYSSDDLKNWTVEKEISVSDILGSGVTANGGRCTNLIVDDDGRFVFVLCFSSVTSNKNFKFVVVYSNTNGDFTNWTSYALYGTTVGYDNIYSRTLRYLNGFYIFVGYLGDGRGFFTSDITSGATWTKLSAPNQGNLIDVFYHNGYYVFYGHDVYTKPYYYYGTSLGGSFSSKNAYSASNYSIQSMFWDEAKQKYVVVARGTGSGSTYTYILTTPELKTNPTLLYSYSTSSSSEEYYGLAELAPTKDGYIAVVLKAAESLSSANEILVRKLLDLDFADSANIVWEKSFSVYYANETDVTNYAALRVMQVINPTDYLVTVVSTAGNVCNVGAVLPPATDGYNTFIKAK